MAGRKGHPQNRIAAVESAARAGLQGWSTAHPQPSKGATASVGIAAALLGTPKVIILDEPNVGSGPRADEIRPIRDLGKNPHGHFVQPYFERGPVRSDWLIIAHGKLVGPRAR